MVLLCLSCHEKCIMSDYKYSQSLATSFNAPMGGSGDRVCINHEVKQVKTCCSVLLRRTSELPESVKDSYERKLYHRTCVYDNY